MALTLPSYRVCHEFALRATSHIYGVSLFSSQTLDRCAFRVCVLPGVPGHHLKHMDEV